jgi:hypothetical protein
MPRSCTYKHETKNDPLHRLKRGKTMGLVEALEQANSSGRGGVGISADELRLTVRSTGPTKGLVRDPKALDVGAEDMLVNSAGKVQVELRKIESKFTKPVSLTYVTAGWSRTPDGHSCPLYKQKRRHAWPWHPVREEAAAGAGGGGGVAAGLDAEWLTADGSSLQFELEHILFDAKEARPTSGWVHSFLRCAGSQCKFAGGDIACTEKGQALGSALLCRGCVRRNAGPR